MQIAQYAVQKADRKRTAQAARLAAKVLEAAKVNEELQQDLGVPLKITPGIYFVGHIVDYDNRVWEQRGGNNFTYMARKVRILSSSDVRCGQ